MFLFVSFHHWFSFSLYKQNRISVFIEHQGNTYSGSKSQEKDTENLEWWNKFREPAAYLVLIETTVIGQTHCPLHKSGDNLGLFFF